MPRSTLEDCEAENDRLLNELHDQLDRYPQLAYLKSITPPRPPRKGGATGSPSTPRGATAGSSSSASARPGGTPCKGVAASIPRSELHTPRSEPPGATAGSSSSASVVSTSPDTSVVARSPDGDTNHEPTPASAPAFFPTPNSVVTLSTPTTSPPSIDHFSPHFQNSGHFGEHCTPNSPTPAIQPREKETSQPLATSRLATLAVTSMANDTPAIPPSIFPYEPSTPGEMCIPDPNALVGWDKAASAAAGPPTPAADVVPPRPLRCGRKPALDDIAKGRLLGLLAYGLSFRQAAAHVGIDHKTILNTIQRDPDFAAQVSEARLDAISQPLLTIIKASRTDWRAAAWLARFLNERRVSLNEVTVEERELRHSHYCE